MRLLFQEPHCEMTVNGCKELRTVQAVNVGYSPRHAAPVRRPRLPRRGRRRGAAIVAAIVVVAAAGAASEIVLHSVRHAAAPCALSPFGAGRFAGAAACAPPTAPKTPVKPPKAHPGSTPPPGIISQVSVLAGSAYQLNGPTALAAAGGRLWIASTLSDSVT